ncbi:unnamed protein product, partial [Prunus brigantina]
ISTLGLWNEGWLLLLLFHRGFCFGGLCLLHIVVVVDIGHFAKELAFSSLSLLREEERCKDEEEREQFCSRSHSGK